MNRALASIVLLCCMCAVDAPAQLLQAWSKLAGTGAVGAPYQGVSVALSADGNTAIVGGPQDSNFVGAAWVFTRIGGVWTQQGGKLVGTGGVGAPWQGNSVSISSDGNTAILGGPYDSLSTGAAWVFTRNGGVWTQQGSKLVGTGAAGPAAQGNSVSLSSDGNTAIVGGPSADSFVGAAWVFTRSGGVWTQQGGKLTAAGPVGPARVGASVSLSSDGNTAIVCGHVDNSGAGAAWVFIRSAGLWTQQGSKLVGTGEVGAAYQGASAALSSDGNTAIVGGFADNLYTGAAWVYTRSAGVWTQQGSKLVGTGAVGAAGQGTSVALSARGDTAIVGGSSDNGGAGAAWVFTRSGTVWIEQEGKLVGTGAAGEAYQGSSVALSSDGKTAIVCGESDSRGTGAAWLYLDARVGIASVGDLPLDQGGTVLVDWNASIGDEPPSTLVTNYEVWRGIRSAAAPGSPVVLSRDEYMGRYAKNQANAQTFMSTRDRQATQQLAGDIYWQYITSLPVHGLAHYSYACPTLADSTPGGIPWRYFFISAATGNPDLYWDSPPDSGYSVDNLAPMTPANAVLVPLAGSRVRVSWAPDRLDPDVSHYAVYRSASKGFMVADSTRVQTTTDSTAVDSSALAGREYYYRITAVDIHGNESIPTPELGITVSAVSGSPGASLPGTFELSQNYPNPFNPATTIRYALPQMSYVDLTVYNELGQQVAVLTRGNENAGYHEVRFDGTSLASGVYFYRIQAGSFVQTRKLSLVR